MRRALLIALLVLPAGCSMFQSPLSVFQSSGGRYVVVFAGNEAELDDAARKVIAIASDYARAHESAVVKVEGLADPAMAAEAGAALTRQRVTIVSKWLTSDGVPPNQIVKLPANAAIAKAANTTDSRNVVVTIGNP